MRPRYHPALRRRRDATTLTAAVTGLPRAVLLGPEACSSASSPVMAGSMLVLRFYADAGVRGYRGCGPR